MTGAVLLALALALALSFSLTLADPHQLQTMLGSKYKVLNFGAVGHTMLKKGDQPHWTTGPLRSAVESKPDIVVLMLGTSDFQTYQ